MSRKSPGGNRAERVPIRLEISRIVEILPHRRPHLLDLVTDVVAGESIRGQKMVTFGEFWCPAQFSHTPAMPGVLVIEALTQLASVLAYVSEPFDPSRCQLYLLGIDKAKFRHRVIPGDTLDLYAQVSQHRSNTWKFAAEATVHDTLCAQADLLASVVDLDN
jgi:3-hydroxyacyl-[acyl-carrier-protein] dehydratase